MRIQRVDVRKTHARSIVKTAVRNQILPNPYHCLCFVCCNGRWETPNIKMVYHHVDYDKPLEVFPLCHSCHIKWHIAMGDYPYKLKKLLR